MTDDIDEGRDATGEERMAIAEELKVLLRTHHAKGVPTEDILTTMGLCAARFMVALHGMEVGQALLKLLDDNLRESPIDRVEKL